LLLDLIGSSGWNVFACKPYREASAGIPESTAAGGAAREGEIVIFSVSSLASALRVRLPDYRCLSSISILTTCQAKRR
jgi:hypothetical protein